jgi:hypothetical protein
MVAKPTSRNALYRISQLMGFLLGARFFVAVLLLLRFMFPRFSCLIEKKVSGILSSITKFTPLSFVPFSAF